MGKVYIYSLCVCLCVNIVYGQFGFFPQRTDRRYSSPFGFGQNLFPNPHGLRKTITNILHLQPENPSSNPVYIYPQNRPISHNNHIGQNRPIVNNQYDHNRPINNDQYYQNRPIVNDQFDQNQPINNDQFDQNRPINNDQFDQNRPINNDQFDQNQPINNDQFDQNQPINNDQFNQNQPINNDQFNQNPPINKDQVDQNQPIGNNQFDQSRPVYNDFDQNPPNNNNENNENNRNDNVRFPSQGNLPNDNVNFGQQQTTSDPFVNTNPGLVEIPNQQPGDQFSNGNDKSNEPDLNQNVNFGNQPTFAPINNDDQFNGNANSNGQENKHGIPDVPPPGFQESTLPPLTPVPASESRNNFGIFSNNFHLMRYGDGK